MQNQAHDAKVQWRDGEMRAFVQVSSVNFWNSSKKKLDQKK